MKLRVATGRCTNRHVATILATRYPGVPNLGDVTAIDWRGERPDNPQLPLYAVLWGGYLASNWIYFHTLQPISGMLKSQSTGDHSFGLVVGRQLDQSIRGRLSQGGTDHFR